MEKRTYRKEAEREQADCSPHSPGQVAMLHREMTEDHLAAARERLVRARATLAAARVRLGQVDRQRPAPSPAHALARRRDTEVAGQAPGDQS